MEKLGWRDRRISPDSGSLFQTFLKVKPASDADFSKVRDTVPARMRADAVALNDQRDLDRRTEVADG